MSLCVLLARLALNWTLFNPTYFVQLHLVKNDYLVLVVPTDNLVGSFRTSVERYFPTPLSYPSVRRGRGHLERGGRSTGEHTVLGYGGGGCGRLSIIYRRY